MPPPPSKHRFTRDAARVQFGLKQIVKIERNYYRNGSSPGRSLTLRDQVCHCCQRRRSTRIGGGHCFIQLPVHLVVHLPPIALSRILGGLRLREPRERLQTTVNILRHSHGQWSLIVLPEFPERLP